MPRKKRLTREESKARTRADLLRAANRLFLRNGFVATSLADIADEAALTKGAVYSNFESKEDLFLAVLQEWEGRDWDGTRELLPNDLDLPAGATRAERARAWGAHLASVPKRDRHVALFLEMNSVAIRNERARAWVAEHNDAFFTRLGASLAELFETPDVDAYELGLLAQSMTFGMHAHTAFGSIDAEDAFARAFELLAVAAGAMQSREVAKR